MKVIRCKCHCGRAMSKKKLARGEEFWSPEHKEWWETIGQFVDWEKRPKKKKQEEEQPVKKKYPSQLIAAPKADVNDRYCYDGKKKCLSYDDMDIKCVMCFENADQKSHPCFKKPKQERK